MEIKYKEILKDMQNRLVSNNTRTNTFFSSKTSSVDFLDLFKYYLIEIPVNENISYSIENLLLKFLEIGKFIVSSNKELIPLNIRKTQWTEAQDKTRLSIFKRLKNILKECTNDRQQFSIESLRIGYPFIKGTINSSNEAANFRAPLFFYDLKAVKVTTDRFQFDISKDFVVNSSIISNAAVYNKVSDFKLDFEQVEVLDDEKNLYLENFNFNANLKDEDIIKFIKTNKLYKSSGMSFSERNEIFKFFSNPIKIEPLKLVNKRDFNLENKFTFDALGECVSRIMPNVAIGRYNLTSTGIFANYEELKNLSDEELEDFFATSTSLGLSQKEDEFLESDIELISKLDYFQKLAIRKSQKSDLVIEGPPGTGKSQTISNIIANILNNNQSALFLTEKKVASEVVFQRIGQLSNLALWIHNVNKDKDSIYQQLKIITKDLDEYINIQKQFDLKNHGETIDEIFSSISDFKRLINSEIGIKYLEFKKEFKKILTTKKGDENTYLKNFEQFQKMVAQLKEFSILSDISTLDNPNLINIVFNSLDDRQSFQENCPLISSSDRLQKVIASQKDIDQDLFDVYLFNHLYKSKTSLRIGIFSKRKFKKFLETQSRQKYKLELLFFKENIDFESFQFLFERRDEKSVIQLLKIADLGIVDFQTIELVIKYNWSNKFESDNLKVFKIIESDWFSKISEANHKQVDNTISRIYWQLIDKIYSKIANDEVLNDKYGKLKNIISKEKGRHNIPRLFKVYQEILEILFPIKISSPDTSSNRLIFPWKEKDYDFVIFDEASQIFTENALPSLFRAKKSIIAGDSKQLRPSNYFASKRLGAEIDEEEYNEILEDENYEVIEEKLSTLQDESLLDFALSRFPKTMLKFHYRSNHKELISYSSAAFYDNELYVSDKPNSVELPLEQVLVENGIKLRKEGINPKEAEMVVQLVLKHIKRGETSIGVITTNSQQMKFIEDLIEDEALQNQKLALALNNNSLFIKNIENVQGDERDIIIFSVAFAPDQTGKFINAFGPIGQAGGPNRLNVAITRSKIKMYVVKSINSAIINSQNQNTLIFKKYLEYVEKLQEHELDSKLINAVLSSVNPTVRESSQDSGWSDSEFELEVFEQVNKLLFHLQDRFEIHRQVQQAGYRIDMTVFDKQEKIHILAIEADGAQFHISTREQKMNDYYRQEYLENQGWKFKRILSTHWWDLDGVKRKQFLNEVLEFVNDYLEDH
ncbi:putative helicase [Spiroplasma sabaudiense Ar-1343]|uniref:Putative helicase n=1 Tax=Spiroplasma sabaudiense Ar-1343 TaxID=1276257 RepID=W6A9L3_9MOLU|nr:AAA domain-containing protein [Spiroplasma sabaudiense]AHI53838.1 putative helicase [Spiroplasma sabaudiense Ar-1343]